MSYRDYAYTVLLESSAAFSRLGRKFASRGGASFLRTSRGQFAGSKSLMSKRLAEKARPKSVYVASPLGFPGEGSEQRLKLKSDIENRIKGLGHTILDPWRHDYGKEIGDAFGITGNPYGQKQVFSKISKKIAKTNANDMKNADTIVAVYHKAPHVPGMEIDAGTVREVGDMHGSGKPVHIFRSANLADAGDFPGQMANLQATHGARRIYRKVKDINF